MNQTYYTVINIQNASEPKTNSRKARCKHCMRLLQPGEGVGYPNEFGYGGGFYYMCQADAAVRDRIDFTRSDTKESLDNIAGTLTHTLDSKGGIDTDTFRGYVSLRNGASLAYGRIQQVVDASGMYRLEVAQAIDAALVDENPATVEEVTSLVERVAVQTLRRFYLRFGELLWVTGRLHKMVTEISL